MLSEFSPISGFYPGADKSIEDLNYFAGLFDGEGCVRIEIHKLKNPKRQNQMRDHLEVVIGNTYLPVLEECKALFGGHVKKGGKSNKQCWHWKVSSLSAARFIREILPYSRIKKDQIEVALEYVRLFKKKAIGNKGISEKEKEQRIAYAKRLSEMKKL
jgi:hypothetical protein